MGAKGWSDDIVSDLSVDGADFVIRSKQRGGEYQGPVLRVSHNGPWLLIGNPGEPLTMANVEAIDLLINALRRIQRARRVSARKSPTLTEGK